MCEPLVGIVHHGARHRHMMRRRDELAFGWHGILRKWNFDGIYIADTSRPGGDSSHNNEKIV